MMSTTEGPENKMWKSNQALKKAKKKGSPHPHPPSEKGGTRREI